MTGSYDPETQENIDAIRRILSSEPSVLFITGAGVSVDSGLPTYRGIGGLYDVDMTQEGLPIEDVLSGTMLQQNPALTWKYLLQIADATEGAQPNQAHRIIAEMESKLERVWTLTQNVDGLHSAAGSQNLIEIHGNMRQLQCMSCGKAISRVQWQAEFAEQFPGVGTTYQQMFDHFGDEQSLIPRCASCQGVLRPNVVLFGEMLPETALGRLRQQAEIGFGLVISIGTSSMFPYISAPVEIASQYGVPTVEINPGSTSISRLVNYKLNLGASEAMSLLWDS